MKINLIRGLTEGIKEKKEEILKNECGVMTVTTPWYCNNFMLLRTVFYVSAGGDPRRWIDAAYQFPKIIPADYRFPHVCRIRIHFSYKLPNVHEGHSIPASKYNRIIITCEMTRKER